MTLEEIRKSDKLLLTASDVAQLLGFNAQSIRLQAREDPSKLGFPVIVIQNRLAIPREPFLRFVGGDKE